MGRTGSVVTLPTIPSALLSILPGPYSSFLPRDYSPTLTMDAFFDLDDLLLACGQSSAEANPCSSATSLTSAASPASSSFAGASSPFTAASTASSSRHPTDDEVLRILADAEHHGDGNTTAYGWCTIA
ncbi:hypothetical protein FB107DRAFT_276244 [Schizophyllum commune]